MHNIFVEMTFCTNWIQVILLRLKQLGPSTSAVPGQLSNGGGKNVAHSPAESGTDF